jgi:hypothetical protein
MSRRQTYLFLALGGPYITPLHTPIGCSTSTAIQTLLANDFSLLLRKRTRVLNLGILAKLSIYS